MHVCASYDLAAIEQLLPRWRDSSSRAAGSADRPVPEGFLARLRALTRQHGCLLVFDEMITGFRLARGGAAEFYDVAPDLSTYGKAMFGGMPGAAVGGPKELMDELCAARGTIEHQGTWNGAPTSCAAGVACMALLEDRAVYQQLNTTAEQFRRRLNGVLAEVGGRPGVR
jgi:glutamate-1-semialdehyde 2,1-aminomutase